MMDANELREQFKSSPDWAYVGLVKRIEALELKVAELAKPKRTTRTKTKTQ